jgi:hypothetical protein
MSEEATENTPMMVSAAQANLVASGAASLINQSADKIKKAKMDGPLSFRTLGFLGGLAMILSNGLGIIDRFFSFNFTGALLAIYGLLFGILSKLVQKILGFRFAPSIQLFESIIRSSVSSLYISKNNKSLCWKCPACGV